MTENVDNIILEHLRAIRSDNAKMLDEIHGLKSEMTAVRHHVRGLETMQDHHHGDISHIKDRLDRIEQRLELVGGEKG